MKPIILLLVAFAFAGCGLVSSSYITSKSDPMNPPPRTAKIWLFVPQGESLDQRIVRSKVEEVMKSLGYAIVPTIGESEYTLGFTLQDAQRSVTGTMTGTQMPVTMRDLSFSIMRTPDYVRYLQTREEPPVLWEGYVGINWKAFDAYGDKAIRELFTRFPSNVSETFTLGPRVW